MSTRSRSISDPLTPALLDALRAQLIPDERLAWAASPEPLAFKRPTRGMGKLDAVAILGGGYVAVGSSVAAVGTGQWLWLSVPIALLVLGVLGYFVARWIRVRAQNSLAGTVYGLTTRRALIVQTYPALAVRALPIDAITDVIPIDARGNFADLCLRTSSGSADLVFRGLAEPERARAQLMRVIRDPQATDQEIAASEAYAMAMHRLVVRPISN
jgi:hypothetical protein